MPAPRLGNVDAFVVHVDVKPWPAEATGKHGLFDSLLQELEADATQADELRNSRRWVAEQFYANSETLASLRLRAGLSQQQMAEACGIAQPHVSRYESGKHAPSLEVAESMSAVLAVDLNTFHAAWKNSRRAASTSELPT